MPDPTTSDAALQRVRADEQVPPRGIRRSWVLAVVCLAQLMITLDITIVNIALPAAQDDLGFSDAQRQWVVTAYALAFGSLLLISGRVASRIGRRTALIAGLAVFGAGSALGGVAPDFALLVAARAIQGVGGALMAPAALAAVTATFVDPRERSRAFAIFGAIGSAGGALGLLLGGVLTEHLTWRWTLYVNLAMAAVTLVGAAVFINRDTPAERHPVDVLGTGLVTAGLFGVVFGFSRAESDGWAAPITWVTLAASAVLLIAFGWWQTRAHDPLLPPRILLDRNRAASLSALMLANVGLFAVLLFLTYYLQTTLDLTPVRTGIAFLPLLGGTFVGAVAGLNVLPRVVGPRIIVPAGMLIAAANLVWLSRLTLDSDYWPHVAVPLALLGLGLGIVFPLAINLSTARLHDDDHAIGGAAVNTTQQVGGSIGIALLSTLAASAATRYLTTHDVTDPRSLANATLQSYAVAYWIAAAVFAGGAVLVAALYRPGIPAELITGEPTPVHEARVQPAVVAS